jgi:hypothetical protein
MKQSSKRLISVLLSLVFLVAALVVLFDLIQPVYGGLQTEKGTEISTQNLLTAEGQFVSQAKNLVSEYEGGSSAQADLALAMPSGPDQAGALAQVYGLAQSSNITVESVQLAPPQIQVQSAPADASTSLTLSQITKPIGTYLLTIAAFGSYENLKSFLSELETNMRIFDVTALSLQAASAAPVATGTKGVASGGSADFFTYTITAETYYQGS